ncbi:ribosomal protein S18 acetylase RimI-like enzyme [Paenibacillus taihuensis]|uniref:Ribosomal protein S18 acetylase RimI-like enzyme n=1 Tax=Paenibacillus taihuensis TaxID=1156355 RepID=A0A3D9RRF9_9BACL|nr:GNAT family N-acetyltransferase [Paenibacillus taihuensis]REE78671.1 ribosomal protein S18 acetylase RimI-like enzyme [Paenibacillus taihuensis]
MKTISNPWLKLGEGINQEDFDLIHTLEETCIREDQTALKLELDYKLAASSGSAGMRKINEFMYFDGQELIGYIGICEFGDASTPLEVNGMVHPEYRRQGVFATLSKLVLDEWKRRAPKSLLLLSDRNSEGGQAFIQGTGAHYHHSEYEMYLQMDRPDIHGDLKGLTFRKATNADAWEIRRQNAIYFGDEPVDEEETEHPREGMILPEEEEKRGMIIYLAEARGQVIGKFHIQLSPGGTGGIYGLGILPEHRGKGYGRATLLKAVDKLKEARAADIMLQVAVENANALGLYQSCGFKETSTMDYYELR